MKRYAAVLCSVLLVLILTGCKSTFNGSRTGNESQLIMSYKILNKTDFQLLELEAGDIINAKIVNDAGNLSITIQMGDHEPIYENKEAATDAFQIKIEESGTYKITVVGEKAKGSVSFIKDHPNV